jgi:hypothetical protein
VTVCSKVLGAIGNCKWRICLDEIVCLFVYSLISTQQGLVLFSRGQMKLIIVNCYRLATAARLLANFITLFSAESLTLYFRVSN